MPNGGVPMHMVIRPKGNSQAVIYCRGSNLFVVDKAEWEAKQSAGEALLKLDDDESLVLERFLTYWLEPRSAEGVLYKREGVDVVFDF